MKIDTEKSLIEVGGINLGIKEFASGATGTGFKIEICSGVKLLKVRKLKYNQVFQIIVKSELPNEKYINPELLKAEEGATDFWKILLEVKK